MFTCINLSEFNQKFKFVNFIIVHFERANAWMISEILCGFQPQGDTAGTTSFSFAPCLKQSGYGVYCQIIEDDNNN